MFSRHLPAHLVPGLEFAIDRFLGSALTDFNAPQEFEVVIVPTNHKHEPITEQLVRLYVGESDELIPVEPSLDDGA